MNLIEPVKSFIASNVPEKKVGIETNINNLLSTISLKKEEYEKLFRLFSLEAQMGILGDSLKLLFFSFLQRYAEECFYFENNFAASASLMELSICMMLEMMEMNSGNVSWYSYQDLDSLVQFLIQQKELGEGLNCLLNLPKHDIIQKAEDRQLKLFMQSALVLYCHSCQNLVTSGTIEKTESSLKFQEITETFLDGNPLKLEEFLYERFFYIFAIYLNNISTEAVLSKYHKLLSISKKLHPIDSIKFLMYKIKVTLETASLICQISDRYSMGRVKCLVEDIHESLKQLKRKLEETKDFLIPRFFLMDQYALLIRINFRIIDTENVPFPVASEQLTQRIEIMAKKWKEIHEYAENFEDLDEKVEMEGCFNRQLYDHIHDQISAPRVLSAVFIMQADLCSKLISENLENIKKINEVVGNWDKDISTMVKDQRSENAIALYSHSILKYWEEIAKYEKYLRACTEVLIEKDAKKYCEIISAIPKEHITPLAFFELGVRYARKIPAKISKIETVKKEAKIAFENQQDISEYQETILNHMKIVIYWRDYLNRYLKELRQVGTMSGYKIAFEVGISLINRCIPSTVSVPHFQISVNYSNKMEIS